MGEIKFKKPKTIIGVVSRLFINWVYPKFLRWRTCCGFSTLFFFDCKCNFPLQKIEHKTSLNFIEWAYLPIRKITNESNEEMLANEHAWGWQKHNTSTRSHTIHQLEVTQVISFGTRNIAVNLVIKLSFTNTQRKPSPPSVESKEIMIDNFLNIGDIL